jgi:hypothetical protein
MIELEIDLHVVRSEVLQRKDDDVESAQNGLPHGCRSGAGKGITSTAISDDDIPLDLRHAYDLQERSYRFTWLLVVLRTA